ncbi:hypothetical protein GSI_10386 [Ganoderma sinense ZZ0214-1]|uniref:Retrotransposon gag domain-containing protein n=1 Tax=Ganoderma sinense ZZ0214-1 TaxID=1077348 RepID=A0A2G8S0E5_9APHY|nr:hypothetical protein GSI_10386 [Ganoderma sinense ZZ0214-1]
MNTCLTSSVTGLSVKNNRVPDWHWIFADTEENRRAVAPHLYPTPAHVDVIRNHLANPPEPPQEAAIAELVKLCKVQHKISTVQDYTVKFNTIAARTSFSAEDKCERYHTGLPYKIKDILATSGHDTSSITKIQAVALTMDQNLLVREEEQPKQFSGHCSFECKLPKKEQQAASSSGETTDLAALRAELKEIKERLSAVSVKEAKEGF